METETPDYQKFGAKKKKFIGNDRLWIGRDHLLLVQSTGVSETYRRFYFKDIQALNLVRQKGPSYGKWIRLLLVLITGALCLVCWKNGAAPMDIILGGLCLIGLFVTVRSFLKGPGCECWIYSSVQKEKLSPVNTMKTAQKFTDLIVPKIEAAQGRLLPAALAAGIQQVGGQQPAALLKHGKKDQATMAWHRALFALLILSGMISTAYLFIRWPMLTVLTGLVFLAGFAVSIVAVIKQVGSPLASTVKTITVLCLILLVAAGILGYVELFLAMFQDIEHVHAISYNSWEMIKLLSRTDPFQYPVILGMDIFLIVSFFLLGISGAVCVRKFERH